MPRVVTKFKDFIRHDPRRSPRWRYERAQSLVDGTVIEGVRVPTRPVRNRDDHHITAAWAFIQQWELVSRSGHNQRNLREARLPLHVDNPGLFFAYDLFTAADGDRTRCELEARLLARQTDEQIAEELGTLPEVIDWYEQLFFNVRDRLHNRGYITNRVLMPGVTTNWDQLNLDLSSKFFGYFAGPYVLDAVLHCFDHGQQLPGPGDSLDDFYDNHFSSQFKRRTAEAVNVFELNKYNVVELFAVHTKLIELKRRAQEGESSFTTVEASVGLVLESINFAAGDGRQNALEQSPLKPYYGHAAELRADEMMRITAGEVPDDVVLLPSLKMPPPGEKINHGEATEQGS